MQALLLQGVAFVLIAVVGLLFDGALNPLMSVPLLALLQGCIAAALSVRLARWWLPIQLLFPVAVLFVHRWQLPPLVFLACFVFFLLLFWSTFRTQVPFYPSKSSTWRALEALLPPDQALRFIDIGSGLGGLVLSLAQRRSDMVFFGIEIAPLPWLVSRLRAWWRASPAHFILGDYTQQNFAAYDVVFAYLSPVAMPALWLKAVAEMPAGSLLFSYEFPIDGVRPDMTVDTQKNGAILYGWRI